MQLHTHEFNHIGLPEQVMPLIYDCVGEDTHDYRVETLKTLAFNYLLLRKRPTRIVFHTVSDVLGLAREQGVHDQDLNAFLLALELLLTEH